MFQKIPGNVQEDSGVCSGTFQGTLLKILGNVLQDFSECLKRFRGFLISIYFLKSCLVFIKFCS